MPISHLARKFGVCTALTLLISACASQDSKQRSPEFVENFHTTITDNGSKMFDYQLRVAHRESGKARQGGLRPRGDADKARRNGSKPDRAKMEKRFRSTVYEKLVLKLEETGYCREGYLELSADIYRGKAEIRGECREGATREDRQKFS